MSVFGMVFGHCRMALCGISAECSLQGVEIECRYCYWVAIYSLDQHGVGKERLTEG